MAKYQYLTAIIELIVDLADLAIAPNPALIYHITDYD